jgi:hypothetical protein
MDGAIPTTSSCSPAATIFVVKPRLTETGKQRRRPIYATETSGLLVIAFLILIFLVVRYWHAIHWSWR